MEEAPRQRSYYWTKVWGRPREPATEALLFNSEGYRDVALQRLRPGDIVVYLTSDATAADPMVRGHVSGAVEIEGRPILAEELGIPDRANPVDFREDGRFRWPYGITISRAWRVVDKESNDNLIPGHREKGLQGAATIHEMSLDEVARFQSLRVEEQVSDGSPSADVFLVSLRRPWRQKSGPRASGQVQPGCDLYVAWIADRHGITFKVGSGKHVDRISALNLYRRPSQGEVLWSLAKGLRYSFGTPEAAQDAEYHLLERAKAEGFGSPDHSEFLVGITFERVRTLFAKAVEVGLGREAIDAPASGRAEAPGDQPAANDDANEPASTIGDKVS
jgi:hypothetical protein